MENFTAMLMLYLLGVPTAALAISGAIWLDGILRPRRLDTYTAEPLVDQVSDRRQRMETLIGT